MATAPSAAAFMYTDAAGIRYDFSTKAGPATIGYYTGPGGHLTIPQTFVDSAGFTHTVRAIESSVFSGKSLTSVTLPDSLTTIGLRAFEGNELTAVTIGNAVTTIGFSAFANNQLTAVTIGNAVTTIGNSAFANNQLSHITVPDSVVTIDGLAFHSNRLNSVTIGQSVAVIGDASFSGNLLTSVTIPPAVTQIDQFAFDNNPGLVTVLILGSPPSVQPASGLRSFGTTDPTVYYSMGISPDARGRWQGYRVRLVSLNVTGGPYMAASGGKLTVRGEGAVPGATITAKTGVTTLTTSNTVIGTITADGSGSFAVPIAIPTDTTSGALAVKLQMPWGDMTLSTDLSVAVTDTPTERPGTKPGTPKPAAPKPGVCTSKPFTDVAASSATCSSIAWLKKAKAVSGKKFHPTKKLTRIDAAQMLYRITSGGSAAPVCGATALARFIDTKSQATCRYATWAAGAGLIAPATAKTFKPNATITRAQLATALYQLRSTAKAQKCTPKKFSDVTAGNSACRAISWVVKTKVMPQASGKKFKPSAKITRQQAAVILAAAAPRIT